MSKIIKRRRAVITAAASIALFSFTSVLAVAPASATELEDAQARYNQASADLDNMGVQIEQINNELGKTESSLEETKADIEATSQKIEETEDDLATAQNTLSSRLASNYKSGTSNFISVILDSTSYSDFSTRLLYMSKISDSDAELIDTVKDLKTSLDDEKTSLESRQAEEETLLEEQKTQQSEMQSKQEDLQEYVNSLDGEVKQLMAEEQERLAKEAAAAAEAVRKQAEEEAAAAAAKAAEEKSAQNSEPAVANSTNNEGTTTQAEVTVEANEQPTQSIVSGSSIIGTAMDYASRGYSYGSPYDCSALTQAVYASNGYSLPRTTWSQYSAVSSSGNLTTSVSGLNVGDLAFFTHGNGADHVGIYAGNGMIVHAGVSTGVSYVPMSYGGTFIGGGSL